MMNKRVPSIFLLISLFATGILTACDHHGHEEPQENEPPTEHTVDCNTDTLIDLLENAGPNGVIINLSQCNYTLDEVNNYPDKIDGDDFGPTGLPAIQVPVTINGFGYATIQRSSADGTPAFRLFFVGEGGSLTLNELTLTNGDLAPYRTSIDFGAAILNVGGYAEINDCIFENHIAYNGGAIHNESGTVLINTSTFEANQAEYGGAIFNQSGSDMEINASSFLTNTSLNAGGALVNNGNLTIGSHDSVFRNNEAGGGGGAIYNYEGTAEISFTSFEYNQSTSGGAVLSGGESASMVLNNDDFKQNTVLGFGNNGGGVIQSGGEMRISGCYFNGNSAHFGGGVYALAGSLSIAGGTSVLNNQALVGGGVMLEHDVSGYIAASHISDNHAENYGGGIANHGTTDVLLSTIYSNEVDNMDSGGVFNQGTMTITKSTIFENEAPRSGGGITNAGSMTIINSTISNNRADGASAISSQNDLSLIHTTIAANTAGEGAALFQSGGDLVIKNSLLAENTAGWGYNYNCQIQAASYSALGENLSDDAYCPDFSLQGVAHIQPLADNGGSNLTHEIQWISPARDAASDCTDLAGNDITEDQRGIQRPQNEVCDIGAYEIEEMLAPNIPTPPSLLFLNNSSCREKPGSEYRATHFFNSGESATVTGINPNQTWFQVAIPDSELTCWVWEDLVAFEGDLTAVEVIAPEVEDEKGEECQPPAGGCPEKDIPICWDAQACECVPCE